MRLPLGPRAWVSGVTVRLVSDFEPHRSEPLDQFSADGISDSHAAEVIIAMVFSSDVSFASMANIAQKAAEIVDDMVDVLAPRACGGPVDRVADPGGSHPECGRGDEVPRHVFDHQCSCRRNLVPPQQLMVAREGRLWLIIRDGDVDDAAKRQCDPE